MRVGVKGHSLGNSFKHFFSYIQENYVAMSFDIFKLITVFQYTLNISVYCNYYITLSLKCFQWNINALEISYSPSSFTRYIRSFLKQKYYITQFCLDLYFHSTFHREFNSNVIYWNFYWSHYCVSAIKIFI